MKIPFLMRAEGPRPEPPSGEPGGAVPEVPEQLQEQSLLFPNGDLVFNEQFRNFSTRFEYRADALSCRFVVITSAVAGEGKTLSAVNLAACLAGTGRKRVLLVDADMRKSDLARALRIPQLPGLSEYLAGFATLDDVVQDGHVKGLSVVTGGKRISEPWQLITGERFREFHREVLERFDVVLLDTPPIMPVSDAMALRELADGFILVYRMGFTPHPMFRHALEEIGEKKMLGVLLNGVKPRSEKYYQRYYGKYYKKAQPQ